MPTSSWAFFMGIQSNVAFEETIFSALAMSDLSMLVVTRASAVVAMIAMPAAVGENDTAAQREQRQYRNQPGDSTQHFKSPHG
ncbi:hypothetical protein [Pseudomonas sp. NMS19W]|uniref:hypothetical protein n=1 Tax=Pseudomonas sp. NMS19W TaxID=3079768 RepID=UPI003F65F581